MPAGPPVKALQQHGVHADITQANQRVQEITDAHQRAFGTRPGSGLVFDLMRGWDKLGGMKVDDLFAIPTTLRTARHTASANRLPPLDAETTQVTDIDLLKQAGSAIVDGSYEAFADQHPELGPAIQRNPKFAQKYMVGAYDLKTRVDNQLRMATMVPVFDLNPLENALRATMIDLPFALMTGPGILAVGTVLGLAEGFSYDSGRIKFTPAPLYHKGYHFGGLVVQGFVDEFHATEKAVLHGDWQDFSELAPFIILDLTGFGAMGAGAVTRASRGASAAARVEGKLAKTAAFAGTAAARPRAGLIPVGATQQDLIAAAKKLGVDKELDQYLVHYTDEAGLARIEENNGALGVNHPLEVTRKEKPGKVRVATVSGPSSLRVLGAGRVPLLYSAEDRLLVRPKGDAERYSHSDIREAYQRKTGHDLYGDLKAPTRSDITQVEVFTKPLYGAQPRIVFSKMDWQSVPADLIAKMRELYPRLPMYTFERETNSLVEMPKAISEQLGGGKGDIAVLVRRDDVGRRPGKTPEAPSPESMTPEKWAETPAARVFHQPYNSGWAGFRDHPFEGMTGESPIVMPRNSPVSAILRLEKGDTLESAFLRQRVPTGWAEMELASENMLWNPVQRWIQFKRNQRMAEKMVGDYSEEATVFNSASRASRYMDSLLGTLSNERKQTRLAEGRVRTDRELMELPMRELDFVIRQSTHLSRMMDYFRAGTRMRGPYFISDRGWQTHGLNEYEWKAIEVLSSDIPGTPLDRLNRWREFHQSMLDQGEGKAYAHERHLKMLDQAELLLQDQTRWTPAFRKAVDLSREASMYAQALRIQHLGLTPLGADVRIALEGLVVQMKRGVAPSEPMMASLEKKLGKKNEQLVKAEKAGDADKVAKLLDERSELTNRIGALQGKVVLKGEKQVGEFDLPGGPAPFEIRYTFGDIAKAERDVVRWEKSTRVARQKLEKLRREDSKARRHWTEELKDRQRKLGEAQEYELTVKEKGPEIVDLVRQTADAFYVPRVIEGVTSMLSQSRVRVLDQQRIAAFDVQRYIPELGHDYRADSIIQGDYRADTPHLISEAVGKTVRAVIMKSEYERLLANSTRRPRSTDDFAIPVDLNAKLTPDLREVMDSMRGSGYISAKHAQALEELDLDSLVDKVSAKVRKDEQGRILDQEIEGHRWVSPNFVSEMYIPPVPAGAWGRKGAMVLQTGNEFFRVATLYLRVAYGLNILSNTGMLWVQQNPFTATKTMTRSLFAGHWYDETTLRGLDVLAGEGKWRSYVYASKDISDVPIWLQTSQLTAEMWHKVADGWMRRAAVIYEIERIGKSKGVEKYKSQEFFDEFLNDDKWHDERIEASRRAQKAMVEFNNLRPLEKSWLRHTIFIYPWRSRSFLWSLRTLKEHPMQSAILAELGKEGDEEAVNEIGKWWEEKIPGWFSRLGYIPFFVDEKGNPVVSNPNQALPPFGAVSESIGVVQSLIGGSEQSSALGTFGPTWQFGMHWITGRDEFGNKYEGSRVLGALLDVAESIPQFAAWKRAQKGKAEPALEPAYFLGSEKALIERRNKALEQLALSPGWWNGWGMLVTGGLTPRTASKAGLIARWWRENEGTDERKEIEKALMIQVLKTQSKLLKQDLPTRVTDHINMLFEWDKRMDSWEKEHGIPITQRVRDDLLVEQLVEENRMTAKEAADAKVRAGNLKTLSKKSDTNALHEDLRKSLMNQFGNRLALMAWRADVAALASYSKETLQFNLDKGSHYGITGKVDVKNLSQDALYDVGRKYVRWSKQEDELILAYDQARSTDKKFARATLSEFRAKADKPNSVGDQDIPSFERMNWAMMKEETFAKRRNSLLTRDWSTMSKFEKEILGKQTTAQMNMAWTDYHRTIAEFHKQNPNDSIQRDQYLGLVSQLNKAYPGFQAEYQFAKAPLYRKLVDLNVYKTSNHKADWKWLFETANKLRTGVENKSFTAKAANQSWEEFAREASPWIKFNIPGFYKEMLTYGEEKNGPRILFNLLRQG